MLYFVYIVYEMISQTTGTDGSSLSFFFAAFKVLLCLYILYQQESEHSGLF